MVSMSSVVVLLRAPPVLMSMSLPTTATTLTLLLDTLMVPMLIMALLLMVSMDTTVLLDTMAMVHTVFTDITVPPLLLKVTTASMATATAMAPMDTMATTATLTASTLLTITSPNMRPLTLNLLRTTVILIITDTTAMPGVTIPLITPPPMSIPRKFITSPSVPRLQKRRMCQLYHTMLIPKLLTPTTKSHQFD